MTDVQEIIDKLQLALGIRVKCGSVTVHINEYRVDNVETKTKVKVSRKVLTEQRPCG